MATTGFDATTLANAKRQLKGQLMLSLESPVSRMHRLAGFVLNGDRFRRLDELLSEIDAVSLDIVAAVTAEFYGPERQSLVRLGP